MHKNKAVWGCQVVRSGSLSNCKQFKLLVKRNNSVLVTFITSFWLISPWLYRFGCVFSILKMDKESLQPAGEHSAEELLEE